MKLLIASDLHGSSYYTSLMLARFDESGASRLVLLGDILYHGPRNDLPKNYAPKEVAAMLNNYADKITAVRGNCEAEVDSLMLDFCVTSDYGVILDTESGLQRNIFFSHGHRDKPKMHSGDAYITGHTHIPHNYTENGVRFINPGSVSIPKENTPHSAVIYDGIFKWIDVVSGKEYSL